MAEVDLTTESSVGSVGTGPALSITPYDPSQDRERLRGTIAKLLLGLLAVVALGSVRSAHRSQDRWACIERHPCWSVYATTGWVKDAIKERHVKDVVEACREIVKEHDDAEAYRWFLLTSPTMIPALPPTPKYSP